MGVCGMVTTWRGEAWSSSFKGWWIGRLGPLSRSNGMAVVVRGRVVRTCGLRWEETVQGAEAAGGGGVGDGMVANARAGLVLVPLPPGSAWSAGTGESSGGGWVSWLPRRI